MRLVLRRARGAKSLLLAAVAATLIAVSFVVGLLDYGRDVVSAAARNTVASAPPEERSVLVRGAADAGGTSLADKDRALRAALDGGLGGRAVAVSAAGYSVGRQLTGATGSAVGDGDGVVFGSVTFLDDLSEHADLVAGAWPRAGGGDGGGPEVGLARAAAAVLGVRVGDRMPITDRRSDRVSEVLVVGIWEPRDLADPYWLLVPGVASGVAPGGSSYGPITMAREDFRAGWAADASVAWIVRPDLDGVGLAELVGLQQGTRPVRAELARQVGLAGTGQVSTGLDRLVDRLSRADLVGRSALLTPVLLIVVLGGYALLLIAMLLTEHRRAETALVRARGASRPQIAGLAAREAALIVAPALLLGPPLAGVALTAAGRLPAIGGADLTGISLRLTPGPSVTAWTIAAVAAVACVVAMVGPSVRRSGTYVEELGARSRPGRLAFAQRASLDAALVALAVLAWFQLRQYASPLAGVGRALGIDPLLVAAPTIGVLAGAVVSLRALPRLTGLAERLVDRRHWPAAMFGTWQAGRRPHAGPVLLLSLAVAVSTLAWSLLSTAQRSLVDQADFGVGADLRLVEANGFAPEGRTDALAALPGVVAVAPVSRDTIRVGPDVTETSVVGIDPAVAAAVVRYRSDLAPAGLFAGLAARRETLPVLALPPGSVRFAGDLAASATDAPATAEVTTTMTVLAADGHTAHVPLGTVHYGQQPSRVEVALPAGTRSIVRFDVRVTTPGDGVTRWSLTSATVADALGNPRPVSLAVDGGWQLTDLLGQGIGSPTAPAGDPGGLQASRATSATGSGFLRGSGRTADFALIPAHPVGPVPVALTPAARAALRAQLGDVVPLTMSGARVAFRLVAEVSAVPGTTGDSAVVADLATLSVLLARARPGGLTVAEHWVTVADPAAAASVADAARAQPGLRVLDRATRAAGAGREPYGIGGRSALFAAALGALLLALIGIAVDVRATARRRVGEFAVLQTLGAGSRLLARSVLAEQALLAGLGVVVGLAVGIGVAATMAPLVILTPAADRPVPAPVLELPWPPILGTAGALFAAAMLLGGLVAATLGRRLVVARLRIGDDA